MTSRVLLALAALSALAAPGVAQEAGRPYDGLLQRPELRAIVDLQVLRDGEALAARLDDADPAVRARAAFALGSVQDPAAVPALLDRLADPVPAVRADAAFALGQSADSSASRAMVEALASETDPAARALLLEALGKVGDAASLRDVAALELPAAALDDLAFAIGRYGLRGLHDPAAVDRLAALLDHEDPWVREAAAWYFGRVSDPAPWADRAGPAVRAALDRAYAFQFGEPDSIAPPGPAPEPHLVAALGRLDDPRDTPRLVHWLEDAIDWRARVNAARALGPRVDEPDAARALERALDGGSHVAVAAATALAAQDSLPDDVVHAVAAWVVPGRRDPAVIGAALPALSKAGADGFVILHLMWLDTNAPDAAAARANALEALGWGETPAGFLVLEDESGWDDPRVAAAAVAGLARRWERGAVAGDATVERYHAAFARAVRSGDVARVSEAAPALADSMFRPLGGSRLLIDAYRGLDDPGDLEARVAILSALGKSGDPAARPVLEAALGDPARAIRVAAAEALGTLTDTPVEVPEAAGLPERTVDWDALERLGPRPVLVLETEKGRIAIEMDAGEAPLTVQTVAALASGGRYDGVAFHRVVPNFVIQGGDVSRGDGWGGPGFAIRTEATRIPFERGAAGIASSGKDTEGSQFFVTHSIQPHLDGRYTAFGRVVEGLEAVDRIRVGDRVLEARIEPSR